MATSRRPFAPVAARPGFAPLTRDTLETGDAADVQESAERPPASSARREHLLARSARPAPRSAATLAAPGAPSLPRLAGLARRARSTGRRGPRVLAVAGVLVAGGAVLVVGVILTGTPDPPVAADPAPLGTAHLEKRVGYAVYLRSFPPDAPP